MAAPSHSLRGPIAVKPVDSHTYEIQVPLDFCFGRIAHGGYEASIIAKTVQVHFSTTLQKYDQPHSFNIHIMFLRPVTAGKAEMVVTDSKLGYGVSTTHVTLSQKGKESVVAYVSNTNMVALLGQGASYDTGYHLSPTPVRADLSKLPSDSDSRWAEWRFPWHPESLLKAYTHLRFFLPINGPLHPSLLDVWLTPQSDGDVITTEMLGYIADIWPRMVESYCPDSHWNTTNLVRRALSLRSRPASSVDTDVALGRYPQAFWYPTLSMTLEIKKLLPPQGVKWLFVRAQAKEVRNGRMDTEVTILDEKLKLVALSHHVCFIIENAHGPLKKAVPKEEKL